MTDDVICVGSISGAFGVRGDVRLKSYTSTPEDIAAYGPVVTHDGAMEFEITLIGRAKNALTARMSGIATKEQADALRGVKLYVPRSRLPEPEEDEFYYSELEGLDVYDTGGALLGRVKAVMNHGAGDILEIYGAGLKSSVLMPFTKEAVPTVDIKNGRLIADPPHGVFPDE